MSSQARRALRALRGLVRLKSLIQGQSVKRQATSTLRCMQTLARVQSQIRARRLRMSEENQALQRQLQQKCEKELEKLRASVSTCSCTFYLFDCSRFHSMTSSLYTHRSCCFLRTLGLFCFKKEYNYIIIITFVGFQQNSY